MQMVSYVGILFFFSVDILKNKSHNTIDFGAV